jgi:hypothetical protein
MRLWDPAFLGSKILSVVMIGITVRLAPYTVVALTDGSFRIERVADIARIVLLLALAALLWFKADGFADLIADHADVSLPADDTETEVAPPPTSPWDATLLRVGIALIGLYLAATALPALASNLLQAAFPRQVDLFPGHPNPLVRQALIASASELVQFAIGVWLIFGSRPLFAAIHRMRYGPDTQTDDTSPVE